MVVAVDAVEGAMPHWRLFYHLVWATRDRMPLLGSQSIVQTLERSLATTCRDLHVLVHAVGVMPDHVHLACSIPPSQSVSQVMKRLKGGSSHRLNQTMFVAGDTMFAWQAEYGVYSFGERALPEVIAYVRDQQARHATANLWPGMEQTESHAPGEREPTPAHATPGDGPTESTSRLIPERPRPRP